jgi:hypothetical protein
MVEALCCFSTAKGYVLYKNKCSALIYRRRGVVSAVELLLRFPKPLRETKVSCMLLNAFGVRNLKLIS